MHICRIVSRLGIGGSCCEILEWTRVCLWPSGWPGVGGDGGDDSDSGGDSGISGGDCGDGDDGSCGDSS